MIDSHKTDNEHITTATQSSPTSAFVLRVREAFLRREQLRERCEAKCVSIENLDTSNGIRMIGEQLQLF